MPVLCLLCYENIDLCHEEISLLKCGHLFHKKCLRKWLDIFSTCPECKSALTTNDFLQTINPSKKEDADLMPNKLYEETKNLVKMSLLENIQNILTKKIKTLESENLKLTKENSRLKIENEHLKNHNQVKKDSEGQSMKTEKKLTPWLSIIKNEEIDITSLFFNF